MGTQIQTQEHTVPVSGKGIDVGKIEKELAAMWKPADEAEGSNAGSGVTRACALNLIVYSTVEDDREAIDDMLDTVNEYHPGRTLVLLADREAAEPKLDAYVSTRCRVLGGSGKQVCGEQVTIEASGASVERAASAIAPLLVPDVQTFLWWKDIPHYEDKLFNRLAAMSDRVVIDSSCFDRPHEDLSRLAQIIRDDPQFMSVSDLNWGRLTAWRTLLANFWDIADYHPYLNAVDRIAVEYDPPDAATEEIAPKALLVTGWLASRLGWDVVGRNTGKSNVTFILRKNERDINVEMTATEHEGHGDGMLVSLTLSSSSSGAEFYVAFSDDRKNLITEASIDGKRTVGRVLSYEQKTEGRRLSRELGLAKRDVIYEEALAVAARLIEALSA
ncbi:MAG TPA: glucose-6-phosphate dehydrogenase assembly protein OpcA [Pyrinomonadaceae bacterium]